MKKKIDRDIFVKSGKKGGTTTAKRGKEYYKEIGSLGGKNRWLKKEIDISPTISEPEVPTKSD